MAGSVPDGMSPHTLWRRRAEVEGGNLDFPNDDPQMLMLQEQGLVKWVDGAWTRVAGQ